ncbi:MAG TPA: response regulator [Moraxellaceae bacterium]|nr:response regulator [Moraxellaceae bacterium]
MKPDQKHSILLVDDHPLLLRGLRQLLELDGEFEVIGEAANGAEALALVAEHSPDLVILDRKMPVLDGLETLRLLRESGFAGKILLFTVSDLQQDVRNALRLGADGYMLKNEHPDVLLTSIREVLAGRLELSEEVASGLRHRPRREGIDLTVREREVLQMIAHGLSNKMVGSRLGITEGTVKTHVKSLLQKIGVRSRVEAAVWALEHLK